MTTFSHTTTADDIPSFAPRERPDAPDASGASDEPPDDARLMAHDYDGIREYDNPLPGWWSACSARAIVFAVPVLRLLQHRGLGPDARPRATRSRSPAGRRSTGAGPASVAANVTEDMLAAGAENPEVVAQGGQVFAARCVGCHAEDGRGLIGPNLTDLYQIHGTTRMDLYEHDPRRRAGHRDDRVGRGHEADRDPRGRDLRVVAARQEPRRARSPRASRSRAGEVTELLERSPP